MELTSLFENFGLPTAILIASFYFIWNMYQNIVKENATREERNYEMLSKFQTSIEKFSNILEGYETKLGIIEKDVKEIKEKVK